MHCGDRDHQRCRKHAAEGGLSHDSFLPGSAAGRHQGWEAWTSRTASQLASPQWRVVLGPLDRSSLGARPAVFGLDRSTVIGFVQIAVYTVGLALICLGGYISLMAVWKGKETSIAAEIGTRLVSTGYVVAVFSSMADIFGLGSHLLPNIPYFGPMQAAGVVIGESVIIIGFLLLIPQPRTDKKKPQKKKKINIQKNN